MNDPEEAALIAALPEPDDEWAPRVSEWTLPIALQYDQRALLVQMMQLLEAKVTGKRPQPVKALPGPRTLLDEIRTSAREQARAELIDDLKRAFGARAI